MENLSRLAKAAFYFFSIILMLTSSIGWCSLDGESSKITKEEKIYVNPEQIEITNHGIVAWLSKENHVFARILAFDDQGLYVVPVSERGPCGIHKRWCNTCGGCGVIYCPMKCVCFG